MFVLYNIDAGIVAIVKCRRIILNAVNFWFVYLKIFSYSFSSESPRSWAGLNSVFGSEIS